MHFSNNIKLTCFVMSISMLCACGSGDKKTDNLPPTPTPPTPVNPIKVQPPIARMDYHGFESAPVRPIEISPNKQLVAVTNTSNHSVELFALNNNQVTLWQSVPVGLEPVAVAWKNDYELWVVNHVSDSVSIIKITNNTAYVVDTLLVGDEPNDIRFANNRAFIATAHRGQRRTDSALANVPGAGDPQLHTPSIGRADIWVFNSNNPSPISGGKPEKIISLFGDSPRSLALSPDKSKLYVSIFHSGNQTTAVHESVMCQGFVDDPYGNKPCQVLDKISSPNGEPNAMLPGGRPEPSVNVDGDYQPWTSMIVKYDADSKQWRDSSGRNFSNGIRFTLADNDVFALNTETLTQNIAIKGVGTTLFNMAVNPTNGELFVANTEANNATRFEGPGIFGGSTVQGHIAESRITVVNPQANTVKPRHLNRHIDYRQLKAPASTKQYTLSTPTQLAINNQGDTLYVTALGSNKIGVLPVNQLSQDKYWDKQGVEFNPTELAKDYINVVGGPIGLALNNKQLLIFTRFDNALVNIDLTTKTELQRIAMATPESEKYQAGRFMLYDANRSSSNGESACGSCHIFGDTDHLAWDLGNPDAGTGSNPQPFPTENISRLGCDLVGSDAPSCQLLEVINGNGNERSFAALKGPMFTQTMRGMSTHGHMHWRGDRSVGYFGTDTAQTLDERTSFKNFIVAFEGLLGMDIKLPKDVNQANKSTDVIALEQDMNKFADFMLNVMLPPNPIRPLNNQLSASAQRGSDFFHGDRRSDGLAQDTNINGDNVDGVNCEGCHGVDHAKGFYGTRGEIAHGGEVQIFKVPQLRNLYTRVGMFRLPDRNGFLPSSTKQFQGEQIRGFGFLHDGATDILENFLRGGVFDNGETPCDPHLNPDDYGCEFNVGRVGIPDEQTRTDLVNYLMEFDNDLAPIVGQQITINTSADDFAKQRAELLLNRAKTPFVSKILGGEVTECDLIAQGMINGEQRGYFYQVDKQTFRSDKAQETPVLFDVLIELASRPNNSLTFTCAVPGQGWQMALDHDLDAILNGDE